MSNIAALHKKFFYEQEYDLARFSVYAFGFYTKKKKKNSALAISEMKQPAGREIYLVIKCCERETTRSRWVILQSEEERVGEITEKKPNNKPQRGRRGAEGGAGVDGGNQ